MEKPTFQSELSDHEPKNNPVNIDTDGYGTDGTLSDSGIPLKAIFSKNEGDSDKYAIFQDKYGVEKSMDDLDEDTICGIGSFHPRWLQPLATPRVFLFFHCIVGVFQSSYYSYFVGAITTLEKRFAYKSKISNTLLMIDEITPLILGVFVGYFGGRMHRPRMLALGMFLSVGCCFLSSMPYFIYGPAQHLVTVASEKNESRVELCDNQVEIRSCNSDDRPPTLAAIFFFGVASLLKGFGNISYYAIGIPYIDDNLKKKNTPLYLAIAYALRLLGPFVGYLMSSALLKINENPFEDPGFGPDDPRWIGGWWIGFVIQGVLLFIFTVPIALFPRRLPGHSKSIEQECNTNVSLKVHFSNIGSSLKRLVTNPLFIFLELNVSLTVYGSVGHFTLLPKYMENQFRLTASEASLYSGPPALAAVMSSVILGGIFMWHYQPSAKSLVAGMVVTEALAATGYLILLMPQCEKIEMANSALGAEGLILDNACNAICNCSKTAYVPVCGPDLKTTYFSPCFAGCSEISDISMSETGNERVFEKCTCLSELLKPETEDSLNTEYMFATEGVCPDQNCWSQALIFIIILPILHMIINFLRVAYTMILLRSVHPNDKSIALGFFDALLCILGFIPFLMISGALTDSCCLIWEESCGETGNCWFYDLDRFNKLLHGGAAFFAFSSALSLVAIYFMTSRISNLYKDEREIVHDGPTSSNAP